MNEMPSLLQWITKPDYTAQACLCDIEDSPEGRRDWLKARILEAKKQGCVHGSRVTDYPLYELILFEAWKRPLTEYPAPFVDLEKL